MSQQPFQKELSTFLQSSGLKSESTQLRKLNILWIEKLDRTGLIFKKLERQILFHETEQKERIYIQYPGKESVVTKQKKVRPWDFRPKIYRPGDQEPEKDMAFLDVWKVLCVNCKELLAKGRGDLIPVIATLLYRMAFMCDHKLLDEGSLKEMQTLSFGTDNKIVECSRLNVGGIYKYYPPENVLHEITNEISNWGGLSFEAFLFLNELMIWNEDCKYYFRNTQDKNNEWIGKTGRVNTILTHLSVLQNYLSFLLEGPDFFTLLQRFANARGISAADNNEVCKLCEDYIVQKR